MLIMYNIIKQFILSVQVIDMKTKCNLTYSMYTTFSLSYLVNIIGVARILSAGVHFFYQNSLALAGGCTSCPAGVHLHIFPVN